MNEYAKQVQGLKAEIVDLLPKCSVSRKLAVGEHITNRRIVGRKLHGGETISKCWEHLQDPKVEQFTLYAYSKAAMDLNNCTDKGE